MLLVMLLSGCWDQVEIKERTTALGIGIDKAPGDESLHLTMQLINPRTLQGESGQSGAGGEMGTRKQGSQGSDSVIIETSQGQSFYDAIRNFSKYSPRRITFFHNRVIILGNEMAQAGIAAVLDDLGRDSQFRPTNWILVAENSAQEILEAQTGLGIYPAKDLDQIMQNLTKNALILPVNWNDFIYQLKNEARTALVPLVQIEPSGMNPTPRIKIEKTAIFKNDRLIGVLTRNKSEGLIWLSDGTKGDSLVFPFQSDGERCDVSVEIVDGSTKVKPRLIGDEVRIEISCQGIGILHGTKNIHNTPETIARLERQTERILKQKLEQTIQKAQQIKADFLGFARTIHGDHPEIWRRVNQNWDEEFSRIQAQVRFQIKLTKFGLIRDSLLKIDDRE